MEKLKSDEIKRIQVEMLKYIDKICVDNNIKYTLIGGSLIGAIRHKGMIPWDDDIDIGLTYENYIKLIKILEKSKEYNLINHSLNDKYYFPFSKLTDKNTILIEKDYEGIEGYGVYLDIFCYRPVPDNYKKAKSYFKKEQYYNFMLGGIKKVNREKNLVKKILKYIRYIIVKIVGKEYYFLKLEKLHNKYINLQSKNVLTEWHAYSFDKELKKREYFDQFIRVEFEGLQVSITKEYDSFLKSTFGDYMKLPPEEERRTHNLTVYLK